MLRYADNFVCLFQYENEAQRFYQLLIERLRKFGLEIAEDKSRILPFGRYKGTKESFDFLGFTHYNVTSHWGKYCVLHRTSRKKLKMKIMKAFLLSLKKKEKLKTRCVLTNAINITSSKELF